jgi:hypothetical protein
MKLVVLISLFGIFFTEVTATKMKPKVHQNCNCYCPTALSTSENQSHTISTFKKPKKLTSHQKRQLFQAGRKLLLQDKKARKSGYRNLGILLSSPHLQ